MTTGPSPDLAATELLQAAHGNDGPFAVFDFQLAAPDDPSRLAAVKAGADLLVRFADNGRTELALTNAGRYWALSGGYIAFLKEDPPSGGGGGGRGRNPEMEALRSEYMRLRLNTFWWTFGMSIAGLIFSAISIIIAVFWGQRPLP